MNILSTIVAHKQKEVAQQKQICPIAVLEKRLPMQRQCFSLKNAILDAQKTGIIAEIKRKSPSKGVINAQVDIAVIAAGYAEAGSSGLSVLTDHEFFGGSEEDFLKARQSTHCPMLRKEFIIDEYQLIEAKAMGADVILLIAAILSPQEVKQLAQFAHTLGLEVLLEIHSEDELQHINSYVDLVGVNNRNLDTFEVSLENSIRLAPQIPDTFVKVSESGISSPEDIIRLKKYGFKGFLMGENFMKMPKPEESCLLFSQQLRALEKNILQ